MRYHYRPDICIYHGNCADGFGAAWAIREKWEDCEFIPGFYGKEPPNVFAKNVLMVDFSYKKNVIDKMARSAESITIIDHHKSAEAELGGYPRFSGSYKGVNISGDKVRVWFDMEQSGATMAWKFAHDKKVPKLLRYVEDRDLWRFEMADSKAMSQYVFSYPYDFEVWSDMVSRAEDYTGLSSMFREGAAIERKHMKDVRELVEQTARPMIIMNTRVMVANLPYTMASDAAGLLAENAPFGACYFDRADGVRVFSLRSKEGGSDVSEIAAFYGGGGHKHAAGFQASMKWEGDWIVGD